jgi:Tfp pilus assembly protein PilO
MRSTVSIKGMIMALVICFIGASLLFYFFLYLPKMNKATKEKRVIASLNDKVEKTIQQFNVIRDDIEQANKEEVNVDYFKGQQIPPDQRTPTFLTKMNELVNRLGIRTIMVKPMDQEESQDYVRYPFLVEAKSRYREIVKFVDSLENSFGLNLDDLHIENDPKAPLWHRLKFTVSTFELKRTESAPPGEGGKVEVSPFQMVVRDDLTVKRDPFLERKPKGERRVVATGPIIRKKRSKRLPRLKLNGIIDIAGKKIAIMNDKIVREGDRIARHRIVRIGEDEVVAFYGRKKRVFKIEALLKTKAR